VHSRLANSGGSSIQITLLSRNAPRKKISI
jgi:hypothetical protein